MVTHIAVKRHRGIDVDRLAADLAFQARQLDEAWGVGPVNVTPYTTTKPRGAWRIQFYETLPPGMGGVHLNTRTGVPFAKVLASEGTVAASHEFCEMLVDPEGSRFITIGDRDYLVEACDPCERITYTGKNGSELSDFILPHYYGAGDPSDLLDQLRAPAPALLPGGYISWVQRSTQQWWQAVASETGVIRMRDLGRADLKLRREKDRLAESADFADSY